MTGAADADRHEPQPQMRRSASTVLIGTLIGNGIAWLLNFVLARIFTNEDFGDAAVVIAVASVFIGVSTLRLEVLSQRLADEAQARLLLRAGLSIAVWWGAGLTAATVAAVMAGAPGYWLCLGAMVAVGSLQLIGATTLIRERRYRTLTWANLQQSAGMSVLQVGCGLISAGVVSLLVGFTMARLVWLPMLRGLRPVLRPWRVLESRHRRFAYAAGPSALFNAASSQLSILLVGLFYSAAEVGNYAMGVRILVVPLAVLSQAVAAAAMGEIGALIRAGQPWFPAVRRTVGTLLLIGAVICGAALATGTTLAAWLLGPRWGGAGEVIALLAIGSWLQFAVAPFGQVPNLAGAHRGLLIWDITRFVLLSLSWIVPGLLGASLATSLLSYSLTMTVVYLLLLGLLWRASRDPGSVISD